MSLSLVDLIDYKVPNVCGSAYYVREWVSGARERELVGRVYGAPRPKWTQLSGRRLQNWGGLPSARGMLAERMPAWLQDELARLPPSAPDTPANHVLVNEYCPGQGIMPHEDGPLFAPLICTLSLSAHTVLRLWDRARRPAAALLLEPRSLLVLTDSLYTDHLHSIEPLTCDVLDDSISNLELCSDQYVKGSTINRDTRVSLTMRHVPKTTTFKLNIGNKLF